jgi:hypothetical protein
VKRWILPLGVLAIILAWLGLGGSKEAAHSSVDPSVAPALDGAVVAAKPAVPALSTSTPLHLDRITSLSQLVDMARTARPEDRAQALSELIFASMVCNNLAVHRLKSHRELSGQMDASEAASLEWVRGFQSRFCAGSREVFDRAMQQLQDEQDLGQDVYQAMGLMLLEDEEIQSVGVPTARKLLHSRQADAMDRAAQVLLGSGHDLVDMQGRLPTALDTAENRRDAQWLAVQIAACRMRGGCGPGGIHTAAWCGRHCAQGRGLIDAWRLKYPPAVLQLATQLSRGLGPQSTATGAP